MSVSVGNMHNFKRFAQRLTIKIYKTFSPNENPSGFELEGINICRKLMTKPETILLISPISGKRYIKSEDNQIFIVIEDRLITIVNHQYSYNIPVGDKSYLKVKALFDNEVENRRDKMESEIKSNVKHSLHNIFKSLQDENV